MIKIKFENLSNKLIFDRIWVKLLTKILHESKGKIDRFYIKWNFFHLETIYSKNQIFKFDKYLIIFYFDIFLFWFFKK